MAVRSTTTLAATVLALCASAAVASCFLQPNGVEACYTGANCRAGFECVGGVCVFPDAFDAGLDTSPAGEGEGEGEGPTGHPRGEGEGESATDAGVVGEGEGALVDAGFVVDAGVLGEGEGVPGEGEGSAGEGEGEGEGEGTPGACVEECTHDADCFEGGSFAGFVCRAGRCQFPACTGNQFCTVIESGGGASPCSGDFDCGPNAACVRLLPNSQQVGRCLVRPQNGFCPSGSILSVHKLHHGFVNVCGFAGSCDAATGNCAAQCNTDASCPAGTHCSSTGTCVACVADQNCASSSAGPECRDQNTSTPFCGCTVDAECTQAGATTCNANTHTCGCSSDADCSADSGGHCFDGICGCFSPMECARTFDGTLEQCVALP